MLLMPNKEKRRKKAANRRKKEGEEFKTTNHLVIGIYIEVVIRFFNSVYFTNVIQIIFVQIVVF